MNIKISSIKKKHMIPVTELLHRNLSEYLPNETELDTIWDSFIKQDHVHSIVALSDNLVVGYGSLVIEKKIRGGKMGHLEDIVTHEEYRQKGIGQAITSSLLSIAKIHECYKVALQCQKHNTSFYEKCGYSISGISMQHFLA